MLLAVPLACVPGEPAATDASTAPAASTDTGALITGDDSPTGALTTGGSTGPVGDTTATTDGTGESNDTGESGSSSGGPDVPADCRVPAENTAQYFYGNASFAWTEPVDEPCTVVSSMKNLDGHELRMDCPVHASNYQGEQIVVTLLSGPMPGELPAVDDVLHVFYQPGGDQLPRPNLLFLRKGEDLIYFCVDGFFALKIDVDNANKHQLPLWVDSKLGDCPEFPNPLWSGEFPGYVCEYEALIAIEFIGDGPALLLREGMSGQIGYGDLDYAVDVRMARRGEHCGTGGQIVRHTVAGALIE